MKQTYRVLVIDDQKEVIDRLSNICRSNFPIEISKNINLEINTLFVEIVQKTSAKEEFEISDKTIENLIKLSSKEFSHIFTDFGFVADSNIYNTLPLDTVEEIDPKSLANKVFTPVDLIIKTNQYIKQHRSTKSIKNLKQNFLNFAGKLSLYSYWDKRFNKVYHSLGERAFIIQNVFRHATFDRLYDIKSLLYDNNDAYKTNQHHDAFLKCSFISSQIILSAQQYFSSLSINLKDAAKNIRNVNDESILIALKHFFHSWYEKKFISWGHFSIILYWIFFIGLISVLPIYIMLHPRLLDGQYNLSSDYHPILLIVSISYFVIILGTILYAIEIFMQTIRTEKEINGLEWLYGISLAICIASIYLCFHAVSVLNSQGDINVIVHYSEILSMIIFAGFFFVDLLVLLGKSKEIEYYKDKVKAKDYKKSYSEKKFIINQLTLIDIPVFLGVLFIFTYTNCANSTGFYKTCNNQFDLFGPFFVVGAIGMHIIFSQFIFVILNTKNIYHQIVNSKN
jgi:hypothetical protein